MINKLKKIAAAKGFTLIETLIAVLLLAMAITGPLSIASKGLTATLVAKDQFVAFYLAQDAIEQVRFLRDSACLAAGGGPTGCPSASWLSGLTNCISADGSSSCYLDSLGTNPASPLACTSSCPVMNYDAANTVFNYNPVMPPTPQKFIRTISIKNDPSGATPDEAVVTVTVSWTDVAGAVHLPVTVRENLFRWQ